MTFPYVRTLRLTLGVALAAPVLAAADDAAMAKLAETSGCTACHQLDRGAKGPDGKPTIGPAWRDVSSKYSGQAGAENKLTKIVLSGTTPFDRHWKEKAPAMQMPANAKVINDADARMLVQWILALEAKK